MAKIHALLASGVCAATLLVAGPAITMARGRHVPSRRVAITLPVAGDTAVVYGPRTFTTPNGSQTLNVEKFTLTVQSGARYLLRIVNGDAGGALRATSGSIVVNGTTIVTSNELASGPQTIFKEVAVTPTDTIAVTIAGPAGAHVAASMLATADPTITIFGPKTYIRQSGNSSPSIDNFTVPAGVGAPFVLYVSNGDSVGAHRAASATLSLNGTTQLSSNDIKSDVGSLTRSLTLASSNTLVVDIQSAPGNLLTARIAGLDVAPPAITIANPIPSTITKNASIAVSGTVTDQTSVKMTIAGVMASVSSGTYSATVPLAIEGDNVIHIVAVDAAGNITDSTRTVVRDTQAPALTITAPASGFVTRFDTAFVRGSVSDLHTVTVSANGVPLTVDPSGAFVGSVTLVDGANFITIVATDAAGNTTTLSRNGTRDSAVPVLTLGGPSDGTITQQATVTVSGTIQDATATTVKVNGTTITVTSGSFSTQVPLTVGLNTITVVATDAAGNATTLTRTVTRQSADGPLPPDPATVAPALNRTVVTTVGAAIAFLYTGANPIQTGVAPGTIDPTRAAVLRGAVKTRQGNVLPGVTISVLEHSEFGQTLSRADGAFDLAVNGGGPVVVNYSKSGYLPVQRQVSVPRQDFRSLPDVVLIPVDSVSATIDFTTPMQVARASTQTDAAGMRRATLLFSQGTHAAMTLPNGTTQQLSSITVRASEYTVGASGPNAMPGALPAMSAYTYAVELSADEALAAGATNVVFDRPVSVYVENFLNLPIGARVPVAFYDRTRSAWVPSFDGRIIKIVGTSDGIATVSVVPSGAVADSATLAKFGISDAERQSLAALYTAGQVLWRVQVTHFSSWDCNFPAAPPDDARNPNGKTPDDDDKDPCPVSGSIIECTTQVLGEELPVTGAPFDLAYRSNRVRGYRDGYSQRIPVTGPTVPPSLLRIDLTVEVAGRTFKQTFSAAANQSYRFTWDGKDAYGRLVTGSQPLRYTLGYVYPMLYLLAADQAASFGLTCPGSPTTLGASSCWLSPTPLGPPVREVTLPTDYQTLIGGVDELAKGLGGWTPTIHHMYDRIGRILYQGDGTRRNANLLGNTAVLAGTGASGFAGDGGPATAAIFAGIADIKAGAEGSVYIADQGNRRIRRIDKNGIITTFAGTGADGNAGDGGPANQAQIYPQSLAIGPDGSVYVTTRDNVGSHGPRIKRITPSGIITTVAGDGQLCIDYDLPTRCGDDGLATHAQLFPLAFDVGPDGTIWIADGGFVLRRVGPDGIIHRVTGDTLIEYCGYGRPVSVHNPDPTCGENKLAGQGRFDGLYDVKVAPDGSVYLADGGNGIIWRIGTDGVFRRVAGSRVTGETVHFAGDGGPATLARFNNIQGIVLASDGTLFIADNQNGRVRRVGTDGIISTIAGNGFTSSCCGAGGLPIQLSVDPNWMTIGRDGALYVSDTDRNRVFTLSGVIENRIASEDGSEVYEFDGTGRHLRTLDALTGRPIFTFAYSPTGLLTGVTDADANVTQLERNGAGQLTAIVSPFGQRTTIGLDASGYLSTLTNPANETIHIQHDAVGLLRTLTDPKGNPPHQFVYDSLGQLTRDTDPAGGYKSLARQLSDTGMTATVTTALGRATTYSLFNLGSGDTRRTETDPAGVVTITNQRANGTTTTIQADGTVSSATVGPDPRFGMAVPVTTQFGVVLPSGLTLSGRSSRVATLSNPLDPMSLVSETDSVIVNGAVSQSIFNAGSHTITEISPEGRQSVTVLDTAGRVIEERAPAEAPVKYTYGPRSLLTSVTQAGRSFRYDYDSAGRVKTVTDPLGRTERVAYDSVGRPVMQILPNQSAILYSYDANGNLVSLTPPGKLAHAFSYTSTDLVSTYAPPAAGLVTPSTRFTYNLDHRLTKITRPDSATIDLRYDIGGRLDTVVVPTGRVHFAYSLQTGQLLSVDGASGGTNGRLSFAYDGFLPRAQAWSGDVRGSVTANYDSALHVTSLAVNGSNGVTLSYDLDGLLTGAGALSLTRDAAGRVSSAALASVTTSLRYHDSTGTLSRLTTKFRGNTLFDASYIRDTIGRVTEVIEITQGVTKSRLFTYDSIGRLDQVRENGILAADYDYDTNGNRTQLVSPSGTVMGTVDTQDRLVSYSDANYSYTANGDLRRRIAGGDTTSYTYDVFGNLLTVRLQDGRMIQYLVDGQNRRIGKKLNGVLIQGFLYQGQLTPIAELDSTNTVISRFVYGTRDNVPDYVLKNGAIYRLVTDQLGSVRLVVDASTGQVVQRIDYDEFGRVTMNSNPGFQPFGFAGGVYDDLTKLTRFGARDYDAEVGRWTTKDPAGFAGGKENLFVYVGNDPINAADPDGLRCRGVGRALASFIPVIGPGWDAIDDIRDGNYGWATIDAGMTVLDGFGVSELTKLGWKTGSHTWSATRKWLGREGAAEPYQHVHHALISQNGWAKGRFESVKNQWWNLKPLEPADGFTMDEWHKMVEGKRPGLDGFDRAWHGSPDWTKPMAASAAGKGVHAAARNPCGC